MTTLITRILVWLEQMKTPITGNRISIVCSILCLLVPFFWALPDHENVVWDCATMSLVAISVVCLFWLRQILESDFLMREDSNLLSTGAFIFLNGIATIFAKLGPSGESAMYFYPSLILWGTFLETALRLKTSMGLVNWGASLAIGFLRGVDRWSLISVPLCLAIGLNILSGRFKNVIFPEDPSRIWGTQTLENTKNLVILVERNVRQQNRIIQQASRKIDELRAALSSTMEAYRTSMKEEVDAKNNLAILLDSPALKDGQIPVFLQQKRQQLNQIIIDASQKVKENLAALHTALDAYETNKKEMEDAENRLAELEYIKKLFEDLLFNMTELARRLTELPLPLGEGV